MTSVLRHPIPAKSTQESIKLHKQFSSPQPASARDRPIHPSKIQPKRETEMSSSAAAKKGASLVVATSMAAVEALKDQAGLCRWDYALRSLYQRAVVTGRRAVPASLSSSSKAASGSAAAVGRAARPRRSEEEKLHKAYHVVCWGPN